MDRISINLKKTFASEKITIKEAIDLKRSYGKAFINNMESFNLREDLEAYFEEVSSEVKVCFSDGINEFDTKIVCEKMPKEKDVLKPFKVILNNGKTKNVLADSIQDVKIIMNGLCSQLYSNYDDDPNQAWLKYKIEPIGKLSDDYMDNIDLIINPFLFNVD